jgi:hypothetical protein
MRAKSRYLALPLLFSLQHHRRLFPSLFPSLFPFLFPFLDTDVLMDRKAQILALWKQFKAAIAVYETVAHEDHLPRARMRQIESRMPNVQVLQATKGDDSCGDLTDAAVLQRVTVVDNSLRWSSNPDKAIKQEIRKANDMSGVVKGFSIDPLLDKH